MATARESRAPRGLFWELNPDRPCTTRLIPCLISVLHPPAETRSCSSRCTPAGAPVSVAGMHQSEESRRLGHSAKVCMHWEGAEQAESYEHFSKQGLRWEHQMTFPTARLTDKRCFSRKSWQHLWSFQAVPHLWDSPIGLAGRRLHHSATFIYCNVAFMGHEEEGCSGN